MADANVADGGSKSVVVVDECKGYVQTTMDCKTSMWCCLSCGVPFTYPEEAYDVNNARYWLNCFELTDNQLTIDHIQSAGAHNSQSGDATGPGGPSATQHTVERNVSDFVPS